jgi:hypothetical protein
VNTKYREHTIINDGYYDKPGKENCNSNTKALHFLLQLIVGGSLWPPTSLPRGARSGGRIRNPERTITARYRKQKVPAKTRKNITPPTNSCPPTLMPGTKITVTARPTTPETKKINHLTPRSVLDGWKFGEKSIGPMRVPTRLIIKLIKKFASSNHPNATTAKYPPNSLFPSL